ncbi:MAG: hypothetical protein R3255_04120 [Candidatus Lokiarchaeia archaeon]|nr:hypothetical protein [Candidatus Lokiarchaeia archaeon]
MKVSVRYLEIMEEDLEKELIWLKEEFQILFKAKSGNYTENERKIANKMLDHIMDNTPAYDSLKLYNMLFDTMDDIENMYAGLF